MECVAPNADFRLVPVNNAAQSAVPQRTLTEEGIVSTLATNHFGHFVLTSTLLPLLKKAAQEPDSDVRVVNVRASAPSHMTRQPHDSLQVSSGAYAMTPVPKTISSLEDLDVAKGSGMPSGLKRYGEIRSLPSCRPITHFRRSRRTLKAL